MRTLKLINENGVEYSLAALPTGFATETEGFGYEIDAKYVRIGNSFVSDFFETKQQEIKGVIEFGSSSPYDAFAAFALFVRTSKTLTLSYATPAGTYYRDVDVVELGKSEKTGATLPIDLTLSCKSLWYSGSETEFTIDINVLDAKKYDYVYPYRYKNFTAGQITLTNDGSVPAPLTVEFDGPITNPSLILYEQDGVTEISRVDITGEAHAAGVIDYSSVDGHLICQLDENGITNLAPALLITNENFFKVPVGTYILEIAADSAITSPVIVIMRKLYKAV